MKVLLVLLVLLCFASAVRTPRGRKGPAQGSASRRNSQQATCKDRNNFLLPSNDLRTKPFSFKCPSGPVFEVNATAVAGECRGYTQLLLAEARRCKWNKTCSLTYRGHPIITIDKDWSGQCVGKTPESFEISFSCIKNKTPVLDVLGNISTTNKESGLVRSHTLYPWSYRDGSKYGILYFTRPQKPGIKNLWFTVQDFGIRHSDFLVLLYTNSSKQNVTRFIDAHDTTFPVKDVSKIEMLFYANYTLHHSMLHGEEKGFLLCFQWLKANATPKGNSVLFGDYPNQEMRRKCQNKGIQPTIR
ncbi:uncharacterized protein LOC112576012 isoform X2 [Pomacea canaliculata]|uniref:uncharacterized protein LOC112576012 isoform X2 n=1 Tax=Pomacea canaliculata TaxID=400727 RepID=UPI000D72A4A1|nr:uncharacterized protein LOC112576012 isoform X2 [Pomacea canaliculata]